MKLIPVLDDKTCNIISEKINDDKEMLKVYSKAFKDLKRFIDNEYKEEIRVNKAIHETDRFIDHETEEWRRSYMLGYHDGKMNVLNLLTGVLNILNNPCVELFNEKFDKIRKEMEENGEI